MSVVFILFRVFTSFVLPTVPYLFTLFVFSTFSASDTVAVLLSSVQLLFVLVFYVQKFPELIG